MAVELANAYINIIPSTKDIGPAVKAALKDLDPVAHKSGESLGSKISGAMSKTLKAGVVGAGVAAGGAMAGAITKGLGRLTGIENAQAKLKGLGNDAKNVDAIMDNALASVKGTAFGLGEAATTAAGAVAAGIKPGRELEGVLKSVANSAAATSSGMDEMGSIFNKVATTGKAQNDVLGQVADRGLPIYQALADQLGVTTEEVEKMASAGKIGFAEFEAAMTQAAGTVADELGGTTVGTLQNVGAAMGRFGEALLAPAFSAAPALFGSVITVFDELTDAVKPVSEELGSTLTPALENFAGFVETRIAPMAGEVAGKIGDIVVALTERAVDPALWERVGGVFAGMRDTFAQLWPSVQSLAGSFLSISKNISVATWEALTGVLNALAPLITSVLVPLVEKTAEFAEQNPGAVQAIVVAFLGFKAVSGPVAAATGAIKSLSGAISILKGGEGVVKALSSLGGVGAKLGKFVGTVSKVAGFVVKGLAFVNPWVAGIAAVAGALTLFFTKTETGRRLWSDFTGALSGGLDFLVEKFSGFGEWWSGVWDGLSATVAGAWGATRDFLAGAWESTRGFIVAAWEAAQPAISAVGAFFTGVWNGIVTVAQWAFTIIATTVLTPLVLAWEAMSWAVQAAWANIIKPTWDALAAGAQWLWNTVLMPTFEYIKAGFAALGDGILWVWENVIKLAWDALALAANWLWTGVLQPAFDGIKWAFEQMGAGLQWVYDNVLKPVFDGFVWLAQNAWNGAQIVFDGIKWAFQALADGLRWVNDNVVQPVWDAFGAGLTWLHDNVVAPVTSWIGDKWRLMGDGMGIVKDWIVDKVFGGFQRGLDTLRGWVGTTADAMGRLWDGIKEKFAKPINFVINFVYNDGVKKVFDAVAEKVGLDARLPAIPTVGGYASGGILPGYTPGRDPYTFVEPRTGMSIGLSGGEAILRPEATRALGPQWVDNINRAARSGGRRGVERTLMQSHFATGGIVHLGNFANGGFTNLAGALSAIQESHAKFVARFFPGMFSLTSASRSEPGSMHDYSRAAATDWQAKDGQYQTQMPTPASKALARAIATNFPTTMQLIHWPEDGWTNLYAGNPHNYGAATNAQHGNHVHWGTNSPLRFDGDDIVLDDVPAAGGGMHFSPLGFFDGLWDRIIGKLPSFDLAGFGDLAQVPGAALKTLGGWVKDWALETLKEWGNKFLNMVGLGPRPAAEWSDMALEALKRMGYGPEHLDAMLKQIQIESGGDPNAVNNWDSNAAKGTPSGGLLQVIEPTYQDVRRRYPEAFEGLPDDRMHPMTNLVAGVGAVKRDWGGPAGRWPTTGGYATGGVLPGFTPGRDIYQFVDPRTGMSVGLSGGEAIMVPEWTRAVGGPAAVAAMNKAARAGRTSGGPGFADGGVFGAARGGFDAAVASLQAAADEIQSAFAGNDQGYAALAATLRNEQWAKAIVDGAAMLGKIADYNSLEGVAARSFASEMADIAGLLGGKTVSTVTNSLLGAEKQIWDAREGYADRTAAIAEKEQALAEARKAAADAASAETSEENKKRITDAEDALKKAREDGDADKVAEAEKKLADTRKEVSEKSAEEVTKANEQVVKAEQELTAARKASAQALDMRIFDVAPQINGMLLQAAAATAAVPQVSGALAGLAAAAGPAGVSVGVAVASLKAGLSAFKDIAGAVDALVGRVLSARGAVWGALSDGFGAVSEFQKLVRGLREDVTRLAMDQALAQIELAAAYRNVRMVAMDGVRAQLEGVVSVAKAQAEFDASLKADMRAAMAQYGGLSAEFDRFRHNVFSTFDDTMDAQVAWSDQTWALWWELQAAQTDRLILEKQAQADLLEAQYKSTLAALDLVDVTRELEVAAQKLALASSQAFGMDAVGATVGGRWANLQSEKASLRANNASMKTWLNPVNWFTTMPAARARMKQIDAELAELESRPEFQLDAATQRQVDRAVRQAGVMGLFGAGDQVDLMMKNTAGDAARALDRIRFESELIDLKAQQDEFRSQVDRSQAELDYRKQSDPLELALKALESEQAAQQTYAEMYRSENQGVRDALLALAKHQEDTAQNIEALSRQRAEDAPAVALYGSTASMDDVQSMLEALGHRVDRMENPPASAAQVAASRR